MLQTKVTHKFTTNASHTYYKGFLIDYNLQNFFTGRIWSRHSTPFPQPKIETYIKRGYFTILSAVETKPKIKCRRCLNVEQHTFITFNCAKCQQRCTYCRHCIAMGRMCSCDDLILWKAPSIHPTQSHILNWTSSYTSQQALAAQELTESIKQNRSHLIHAVCGAGKTEILFAPIYEALQQGKRVCVATPRTDVVLELFPRFKQVFPQTMVHAYYGGVEPQQGFAQLVISTTHQLYRFEHAFDVMIVDEADAFPYIYDEALQRAVLKAKTTSAPIAFVTATPSKKLLLEQKQDHWGYSFIARRFHGHPLPVPKFQALWNYEKAFRKGKIPHKFLRWLHQKLQNNEPFLIFFLQSN